VPLEACARAYVRAARELFAPGSTTGLTTVRLVLLDGPLVAHVERAMAAGS
jgi:hypothetical protein